MISSFLSANLGGNMKRYVTYEDPLKGRIFTLEQIKEVYRDMSNKEEYPDFYIWFTDMINSGVFETFDEEK